LEQGVRIAHTTQDFAVMAPMLERVRIQKYEGEFGVLEALNVRIELNKDEYYLDDVIIGKITAFLVKLNIKKVQLSILKTESYLAQSQGKNMIHSKTDIVYQKDLKQGKITQGSLILMSRLMYF